MSYQKVKKEKRNSSLKDALKEGIEEFEQLEEWVEDFSSSLRQEESEEWEEEEEEE